ncbi:dihydropteroate synthase [Alloprevotella sp. oral taxon 473]|uniref:dihydropteroate synthase n=1 Tax=Alloprevotella sp. oral taxon 473 TaxID=712469 RepID=UPI0002A21FE6|nr:dihydropteroate synthase [Alloprevotella sp. oral taxon 473]EKX89929.1 dihydropteroate synthase [Alloprevotella sp. oral taxon 473 str. F0040]
MFPAPYYTLNFRGKLVELQRPWVMGILNVTPDSFYADSRTPMADPDSIQQRVREMLADGADLIDVGAYSSRPGADDISPLEEMRRLEVALAAVRSVAPEVYVSVDTFRSEVARQCVEHFGVDMINDISGGVLDKAMPKMVARMGVPYVMMHMQGKPETMQTAPEYEDVLAEVLEFLARQQQRFFDAGGKDVVIDPGFGFGKTMMHNYRLMDRLEDFHELHAPLLVGVSRKSMIYKLLETTPQEALNGTTVLHTLAMMKGAHILRVHDVRAAVEARTIVETMWQSGKQA